MKLPQTLNNFIETQNQHNSVAYTACFSETAIVHDEGKTHIGKPAIKQWIEDSNQKYQSILKPLNYNEFEQSSLLTAEVSGNFPGSPAILHFHLVLNNEIINSLKITG